MWGFTFGFRKYDYAQYFGFNLFTSPGTTADGCFGDYANVSNCYLGSPTVKDDLHHRAQIMLTAIRNAYASETVDRRDTVLKIFLAPEFYWRGPFGAYRIDPNMEETNQGVAHEIMEELSKPKYENWVFVLGTLVMAEKADPRIRMEDFGGNKSVHELTTYDKVVYYNFAPIHIGGSTKSYAEFKSYISGIDFLQRDVETNQEKTFLPPPGTTARFCAEHPKSHGCIYGHPGSKVMKSLGLGQHRPLERGVFDVGGVAIGIEVCLDHRMGKLAESLDPSQSVDIHLIVSEGMNIAMGPVCTRTGGPVFLADGSARTEMSMNQYGTGRIPVKLPNGRMRYELGVAYGSDSLVAFQQWLGDIVVSYTGQAWGPRAPGEGTLPGGSLVDGKTGIKFHRILALGEKWKETIDGYYHTASYEKAQQVYDEIAQAEKALAGFGNPDWIREVTKPIIAPSIDIYGPVPLVDTDRLW